MNPSSNIEECKNFISNIQDALRAVSGGAHSAQHRLLIIAASSASSIWSAGESLGVSCLQLAVQLDPKPSAQLSTQIDGESTALSRSDLYRDATTPDEILLLLQTSGTTGKPKSGL